MTPRYGRDSRYRHTPTVIRTDHTGRVLPVDDARPRPPTGGSFTHLVDGNDRLDHLGQRYYGKPHKWWAIADANPEFASPLALLGLDPVTAVRVMLTPASPVWKVLEELHALVGVDDAVLDEDGAAVTVTFNEATVSPDAVLRTVRSAAEAPGARIGPADRVGKPVVVPPEPTP